MKNLITCLTVTLVSGAVLSGSVPNSYENDKGIHAGFISHGDINQGPFVVPLDVQPLHPCISDTERSIVNEAINQYRKENPERALSSVPGVLTFFPMGGRLYGDIYTNNFVDLDPGSGHLDWDCTDHTRDGHLGNDTILRSFAEQLIGVPVFSAMNGVVTYTNDGEYDMNVECDPDQGWGNAVIIDHGGDLFGYYWHHKNGSVSVSVGDTVVAGQQIAEIASSGCSTAPHLHLELRNHGWFGGVAIEPYTGDCNSGESMWEEQVDIERELYVSDHGISSTSFDDWPAYPYRLANDRQFLLSDTALYYWQIIHNLPASGTFDWSWWRPDGALAHSHSQEYDHGAVLRLFILDWIWDIYPMHVYPGTWHVSLEINGESVLDMYPEVVEELDPTFNRPPVPIDISIHPEYPEHNDVIECTVLSSLVHDDPDRDLVRYRYEWKVNNVIVRDVVVAAMRDVLQRDLAGGGDVVSVTVTPSDGDLDGASITKEVTISSSCPDINGDGLVNVSDLLTIIDQWGLTNSPADVNADGIVNVSDLLIVIDNWGACE